ncbi:MAG: hypothetical protein RLY16_1158 [Bacteroidota bacterium]
MRKLILIFSCMVLIKTIHGQKRIIADQDKHLFAKSDTLPQRQLQEVVISSNPVGRMLSVEPVIQEVYGKAFLQNVAAQNIAEAAQWMNGLQSQNNCNVCNTTDIRINGLDGAYSMVLIDGMPLVGGLSTVYALSVIPSSIIEQVEVQKGAASVQYGSEAIAGVINIQTIAPDRSRKILVDASLQSNAQTQFNITGSLPFKNWRMLTNVMVNAPGRVFDKNMDGFADQALQQRWSVFQKWVFEKNKQTIFTGTWRLMDETRWGGQMDFKPSLKGSDLIYGEWIHTQRFEGLLAARWGKQTDFNLAFNTHQQQSFYGTTSFVANQQTMLMQLRWHWGQRKVKWLAGLPLRWTRYDDETVATYDMDKGNVPMVTWLPGVWMQYNNQLNKQLELQLGGRIDYSNQHGFIATPGLAVKWQPKHAGEWRFNWGTGFRVVNVFTEEHAALSGSRTVVLQEDLRPERSFSAQVNWCQSFRWLNGVTDLDITLFYTRFKDKVQADYLANPQEIRFQNIAGSLKTRGISINANWMHGSGLRVNSGCTWMLAGQTLLDESGVKVWQPQLFAPNFSAVQTLGYRFKKQDLSVDINCRITGPMHMPIYPQDFRPERSPWTCMTNLQLRKKMNEQWQLQLSINNLLNQIPKFALLHADDPFNLPGGLYFDAGGLPNLNTNPNGYQFDTAYSYAPMRGLNAELRLRFKW